MSLDVSLQVRLQEDLKSAMRSGDTLTRDTLRMVMAAVKNRRIEIGKELDDEAVLAVMASGVKSREDSATQYDAAKRQDLADKERAEIAVIQRYLPAKLDEAATRAVVEATIAELGLNSKKELGRLMKTVLAEHKQGIDGKLVQRLAAELLD
jgi:uncharacterized protein YqeY